MLPLSCDRLQLKRPVHRTAKLFSTKATGYCVELPDWRYSVVCDVESDRVHFDNFNGRWGKQRELYRLLRPSPLIRTRLESRRCRHMVTEQSLNTKSDQCADGDWFDDFNFNSEPLFLDWEEDGCNCLLSTIPG